tara:strand:+ start:94 stop:1686 length:1593 start_codon:yes stop_codon:yes gene_type:complete
MSNNIIGILKLSSRVKYGNTKRGIPYYKFKPSDKDLSIYLVSTKIRIKKDVFAVILPNKNNVKKYKRGNLDFIIGEVGNIINEYKYILYQTRLFYKSWDNIIKKNKLQDKIENDIIKDIELQKIKPSYNVISIDPLGCTDIDDALHIEINENIVKIGIHITNVNYYLDNNKLNNLIKERLFSVYSPLSQQNMIPDIYANNLCSLLENKNRKTISIIYTYTLNKKLKIINKPLYEKQELYKIINETFEIKSTIVNNNKNYSYKDVDVIKNKFLKYNRLNEKFKKKINEKVKKKLNKNGIMIYNLFNFTNNVLKLNLDSHKLVEYFMIKANTTIGNYLFKNLGEKSIIRNHLTSNKIKSPDEINEYMNLRLMKKATYNFADLDITKNYHYGLNIHNYTHFTSPIRRYNDIIIHTQILNIINNTELNNTELNNTELINQMNLKQQKINKCERMIRRLNVINKLENEYLTNDIFAYAYVVDKQEKYYTIYIPKYKLEEKIYDNTKYNIYDKCNIVITPFLKELYYWNKIQINVL